MACTARWSSMTFSSDDIADPTAPGRERISDRATCPFGTGASDGGAV